MTPSSATLPCTLHKEKLEAFKEDVQANFLRFVSTLPNGPDLRAAEQVSPVRGMVQMANVARPPAAPGVALIGDAALTSDPLWGQGIAWAMQAAAWLVDATAPALRQDDEAAIDAALDTYRRTHHQNLGDQFAHIADFSRARRLNVVERLLYAAAARDPQMAPYTGPKKIALDSLRLLPPVQAFVAALGTHAAYYAGKFKNYLYSMWSGARRRWQQMKSKALTT